MFEHFLVAKSQVGLLEFAKSGRADLPRALQYDLGMACTSRLNKKTSRGRIELASDGCNVIDFSLSRVDSFLLKIDCLAQGGPADYVTVISLIEYSEKEAGPIMLSIGIQSEGEEFDFHKQCKSVEWYTTINRLSEESPRWFLQEMLVASENGELSEPS